MAKFELKLAEGRLMLDFGCKKEDVLYSRAFTGLPEVIETSVIGPAQVIAEVELDEEAVALIEAMYRDGGSCDWCDEIREKLRPPHMFDAAPGKKMCKHCWNHDRAVYLGSYGEDIGPFDENDKSKKCAGYCGNFIPENEQLALVGDDEAIICQDCADQDEEMAE